MKDEKIFQGVAFVLVEELNCDADEVKPESTIMGNLGGESIDLLGITFRLECKFGIKIPRGDLFPERIFVGYPEFVDRGVITPAGLEEVERIFPTADLTMLGYPPDVAHLWQLFTVAHVCNYIKGRLSAAAEHERVSP